MMGLMDAFKMAWGPTPGWIAKVRESGQPATALVLRDPAAVAAMKGVGGYRGKDGWIDVDVRVKTATEPPFEATMKCRLSEAMFGRLSAGMDVSVRYDPTDKGHVVLMDDANALLQKRVITP
jgi:hypothetical protein